MAQANFGINYLINVNMEKLSALDALHSQLMAIRKLSSEGADFHMRISTVALKSLRKTVTKEVKEGFIDGINEGRVAAGGKRSSGGGGEDGGTASVSGGGTRRSQSADQIIQALRAVERAVWEVAARVKQGPQGSRLPGYREGTEGISVSGAARSRPDRQVAFQKKLEEQKIKEAVSKVETLRKAREAVSSEKSAGQNIDDMTRAINDLLPMLGKKKAERVRRESSLALEKITAAFGRPGKSNEREVAQASKELYNSYQQAVKALEAEEIRWQKQIEMSRDRIRTFENWMTDRQGRRKAQQETKKATQATTGTGTLAGTGGEMALTLDVAQMEGKFIALAERMAERFAKVVMKMYDPDVGLEPLGGPGVSGTGAGGPGGVRAQPGSIKRFSSLGASGGCSRCGGTGRYPSKRFNGLCGRCGGSGNEDAPDTAALAMMTATEPPTTVSGMKDYEGRLPGQPNYKGDAGAFGEGTTAADKFAPASTGRQAALLHTIRTLTGRLARGTSSDVSGTDRALKPAEIAEMQDRIERYIKEFDAGGVSYREGTPNPFIHKGIAISRREAAELKKDPNYVVQQATVGMKYNEGDPIQQANQAVNKLLGSINRLNNAQLDRLSKAFGIVNDKVQLVASTLRNLGPLIEKATGKELDLDYTKKLNEERERHAIKIQEIKGGNRQKELEAAALREQKRRSLADRAWTIAMAQSYGDDPNAPKRLVKSMHQNVTRMGSVQTRMVDTGILMGEYRSRNLDTQTLAERMNRLDAEYSGRTVKLARQAALAAAIMPQQFGALAQPAQAFNTQLDRVRMLEDAKRKLQGTEGNAIISAEKAYYDLEVARAKLLKDYAGEGGGTKTPGTPLTVEARKKQELLVAQLQETYNKAMQNPELQQLYKMLMGMGVSTTDLHAGQVQQVVVGRDKTGAPIYQGQRLQHDMRLVTEKNIADALEKENGVLREQAAIVAKLSVQELERERALERQGTLMGRFVKKFSELSMYMAAGTILYGIQAVVRDGIRQVILFEREMAAVQGVFVNKTVTEREEVQAGVMRNALDFGVPLSDVTRSAKIFAQTGIGPKRTLEMTRAALLGTVGAGLEQGQATEMMIAVDNLTGGRVGPENIVDRISRIEARNAVTAQDLSIAIQRVGSLAVQMQPTSIGVVDALDTVIAASTAIIERTRVSGSQAATSLRFMISRLSAPDVARKLQGQHDIKLAEDVEGTRLRPLPDILGDIAAKYQSYMKEGRTVEAANLLTTFAGARQVNAAAALFKNWNDVMETAQESSLAFGDAQRRLAIQLDTLSSRLERTHNAFYAFMTTLIERTPLMWLAKRAVTGTGKALETVAESPGLTGLTAGATAYGIGRTAQWAGSLAGRNAIGFGMVGASALTAGAPVLMWLGIIAAGIGALTSLWELFTRNQRERDKMFDKYGPAKLTWDDVMQSPQFQAIDERAARYGLTPMGMSGMLVNALRSARSGAGGRLGLGDAYFAMDEEQRKENPALARALEKGMLEYLDKNLPGFVTLGDETERLTEAMALLKGAIMETAALSSAQQGKLREDVKNAAIELRERMLGRTVQLGQQRLWLQDEQRWATLPTQAAGADVSTLGFGYSQDAAKIMGRRGSEQQARDVVAALEEVTGGFGRALSQVKLPGDTTTITQRALALVQEGAAQGITLGQALDRIAQEDLIISGTETKAQLAEKQRNQKMLQEGIYARMRESFMIDSRRGALAGGGGQLGVGGGAFATALTDAFTANLPKLIKEIEDPAMARELKMFEERLRNPENRGRFAANIIDNRARGRVQLRDRMLESLLRFRQQMMEIEGSERGFAQAGVGYDALSERRSASQQALRGFYAARAQIENDLIRAVNQQKNLESLRPNVVRAMAMIRGEESTEKLAIDKNLMSSLDKSFDEMTETQKQQLSTNVEVLRQTITELKESKDFFETLPEEQRQQLLDALRSPDWKVVALTAPDIERAFIERVKYQEGKAIDRESRLARAQEEATRAGFDIRARGDFQQMEALYQARLAGARQDTFGAFVAQAAGIEQDRTTRAEMADLARRTRLREIRERPEEFGPAGSRKALEAIRVAGETYQQAIREGNHEAARALLQLLNDAAVEYQTRVQGQVTQMSQGATAGLREVLSDWQAMGNRPLEKIVMSFAQTVQSQLAGAFVDNLFGPNGIFGNTMRKLFDDAVFMEAETIRLAHIKGITEGMRLAYAGGPGKGMGQLVIEGPKLGEVAGPDWSSLNGRPRVLPSGFVATTDNVARGGVRGGYPNARDMGWVTEDRTAAVLARKGPASVSAARDFGSVAFPKTDMSWVVEGSPEVYAMRAAGTLNNLARGAAAGLFPAGDMSWIVEGSPSALMPSFSGETLDKAKVKLEKYTLARRKTAATTLPFQSALLGKRKPLSQQKTWETFLGNYRNYYGPDKPLPDPGQDIIGAIYQEAVRQGVDPLYALSVAWSESALRMDATGPSHGEIGLFQLNPEHLSPGQLERAKTLPGNAQMGIGLLKDNLKRYGGNPVVAQAAYNAGPMWADRYGTDLNAYPWGQFLTGPYVKRVLALAGNESQMNLTPLSKKSWENWKKRWEKFLAQRKKTAGAGGASRAVGFLQSFGANLTGTDLYASPPAALSVPDFAYAPMDPTNLVSALGQDALRKGELSMAAQKQQAILSLEMEAAEKAFRKEQLATIGKQATMLFSNYLGANIGNRMSGSNKGANFAGEGSMLGAMAGEGLLKGALGPTLFAKLGVFGGPIGILAGGILGGVLGGLFKKKQPRETPEFLALEKIERNTRETVTAITNAARMASLDNRLLNVPASFVIPQFTPFGVGAGMGATTITLNAPITINGATDPGAVEAAVSRALQSQLRAAGGYVSSR